MKKKRAKKLLMAAGFDRNAANWVICCPGRVITNKETVSLMITWKDAIKEQNQKDLGGRLSLISIHERKNEISINWKFEKE